MSASQQSTPPVRLTTRAHETVAAVLRAGDLAVDATAGNGVDTEFLARRVGPQGRVLGLDIQTEAIERTRTRLADAGLENVDLRRGDHANLAEICPAWSGAVAAVMFNLGYLPRGDPSIRTHAESTLAALDAALWLLRDGGVMTILAYRGHPGGRAESDAVASWIAQLPAPHLTEEFASLPGRKAGPHLYVVWSRSSS